MGTGSFEIRGNLENEYQDVFTREAVEALEALAKFDTERKAVLAGRTARRAARFRNKERTKSLDPNATIGRTNIKVQDARDGNFVGSEIPHDLRRQWIQGTGPAAKPNSPIEKSIRNMAYALLSGADGCMFDGEDALGQISTMSLDNQRNLKLAINRDNVFMKTAEQVAQEMNDWGKGFFRSEDALGQISTMSLDNQRNLKLAINRDNVFMKTAEQVAQEMNDWGKGFF